VISLATAIAHVGGLDFVEALTERERLVLACMGDIWLRPDQRIPAGPWVRYGFICGRGFGKTHGIGTEVNRRVSPARRDPSASWRRRCRASNKFKSSS
jgi:hypothetical protein